MHGLIGRSRWRHRALEMALRCVVAGATLCACSEPITPPVSTDQLCSGYRDWQLSAYVLPYPVGSTRTVIQGNCAPAGSGHREANRYAYDFDLPIGSAVVAARGGRIVEVEQSHSDGQVAPTGFDNYIVVRHEDGTAALYGHLTQRGAAVQLGDSVRQGALIGYSGNTGNTGNIPHLHFSVHACDPVVGGSAGCPTLPSTFRNTDPNSEGLQVGRSYAARPY